MKSVDVPVNFDDVSVDRVVNDCLLALKPLGVSGLIVLGPNPLERHHPPHVLVAQPPHLFPHIQQLLTPSQWQSDSHKYSSVAGASWIIGSHTTEPSLKPWADFLAEHGYSGMVRVPFGLPGNRQFECIALGAHAWPSTEAPAKIAWEIQQRWSLVKARLVASRGPLSPREVECLELAFDGLTARESARRLGCSERTVNFHINNSLAKLKVDSKLAAVKVAIYFGYL